MGLTETSRFISLILRHKPEVIGIHLDEHGWAKVDVELKEAVPSEELWHKDENHALQNQKAYVIIRKNATRGKNYGHSKSY